MSEYHPSSYGTHDSQGHDAQGGLSGFAGGYDDEIVYGDEGPAYGDEGPAYGDAGAYTDEAAYGDQGPAEYSEEVAYTDYGPSEYSEDVAYGDAGAYGEAGAYDEGGHYDDQAAYGDEGAYAYSEESAEPAAEAKPRRARKGKGKGKKKKGKKARAASAAGPRKLKPMIAAGVGLLLVGAMGVAGAYLLMNQGGEGGFDLASVTRMIPFLGGGENEETLSGGQANVLAVKQAIDAYVATHGQLPTTGPAVQAELARSGAELHNPYKPGEPITIEFGEAPSAPGAVAFIDRGKSYELRVGGAQGQTLQLDGSDFVVTGRVHTASTPVAARPPAAVPAARPASKPASPAAKPSPAARPKPAEAREAVPEERPAPRTAAARPAVPAAERPNRRIKPTPAPAVDSVHDWLIASEAKPKASAKPITPAQARDRNREFDRWRNQGIALVYEQRTAEAVACFKKALALRPSDPVVTRWLTTIQGVIDTSTEESRKQYETPESNLRLKAPVDAPALPPNPKKVAEDDAKRLLQQLKGQDAPRLAPPKLDE